MSGWRSLTLLQEELLLSNQLLLTHLLTYLLKFIVYKAESRHCRLTMSYNLGYTFKSSGTRHISAGHSSCPNSKVEWYPHERGFGVTKVHCWARDRETQRRKRENRRARRWREGQNLIKREKRYTKFKNSFMKTRSRKE